MPCARHSSRLLEWEACFHFCFAWEACFDPLRAKYFIRFNFPLLHRHFILPGICASRFASFVPYCMLISVNRLIRLAQFCTQFKAFGNITICSKYSHIIKMWMLHYHANETHNRSINHYLCGVLEPIPYVFCWRHRGFNNPSVHPDLPDGVHVNSFGQYCLYRSYRGAIFTALRMLPS